MKLVTQLVMLLILPGIAHSQDYQITILVEDAGGRSQELVLGESEEATDGLDSHLGEYQLPPLPPSTAFDVRWLVPDHEGLHIDYRPPVSETHTQNKWTMRIQTSPEHMPVTVSWDPSGLWEGAFILMDKETSDDEIVIDMQEEGLVTISGTSTIKLEIEHRFTRKWATSYSRDWHMASLPVVPAVTAVSDHFPASEVFLFASNGYQSSSTLPSGEGFWIYLEEEYSLEMEGEPLSNESIPVQEGWNLIGAFPDPVAVDNLATEPVDLAASLLFSYDQGYVIVDALEPGTGYWFKAGTEGELLLSGETPEKSMAVAGNGIIQTKEEIFSGWNILRFTDAAGRSGFLLFGDEQKSTGRLHQDLFHLPPKPPLSAFDVRYADDNMLAVFSGEDIREFHRMIDMQTSRLPVEVRWDVDWADSRIGLLLTDSSGDSEWIRIHETGSVVIAEDIVDIALAGEGHVDTGVQDVENPVIYVLEQNYPNPFNPDTQIRFSLPEQAHVTLSVYNILGQRVAGLVSETRPAGWHEVNFDAGGLSSGVYMYRLESGGFVQTRQMLLAK